MYQTKYECILMPAPFLAPNLHQFSAVVHILSFFYAIWDKYAFNLMLI